MIAEERCSMPCWHPFGVSGQHGNGGERQAHFPRHRTQQARAADCWFGSQLESAWFQECAVSGDHWIVWDPLVYKWIAGQTQVLWICKSLRRSQSCWKTPRDLLLWLLVKGAKRRRHHDHWEAVQVLGRVKLGPFKEPSCNNHNPGAASSLHPCLACRRSSLAQLADREVCSGNAPVLGTSRAEEGVWNYVSDFYATNPKSNFAKCKCSPCFWILRFQHRGWTWTFGCPQGGVVGFNWFRCSWDCWGSEAIFQVVNVSINRFAHVWFANVLPEKVWIMLHDSHHYKTWGAWWNIIEHSWFIEASSNDHVWITTARWCKYIWDNFRQHVRMMWCVPNTTCHKFLPGRRVFLFINNYYS